MGKIVDIPIEEESIYNLIPHIEAPPQKAPLFQSKFRNTQGIVPKRPMGSIGPAKAARPNPREFLKKNTMNVSSKLASPTAKVEKKNRASIKEAVPLRSEKPLFAPRSTKSFVQDNKVESILVTRKKAEVKEIDYRNKEEYGAVPKYMEAVKNEVLEEKKYIDSLQEEYVKARKPKEKFRELTEEEKTTIVNGLKEQHALVSKEYSLLPVTFDTLVQVQYKEQLEAKLEGFEKDIERLSKKHVLVEIDDE